MRNYIPFVEKPQLKDIRFPIFKLGYLIDT